jgi:hypothetical protein
MTLTRRGEWLPPTALVELQGAPIGFGPELGTLLHGVAALGRRVLVCPSRRGCRRRVVDCAEAVFESR